MAKNNKKIIIIIALALIAIIIIYGYSLTVKQKEEVTVTNVVENIKQMISGGGGGSGSSVVNNGVGMEVSITNEYGKVQQELLGPADKTFSIISSITPNGFISLSAPDCSSSGTVCTKTSDCPLGQNCVGTSPKNCQCSFLVIAPRFDNLNGNSDISIDSVSALVACASGNSDPNCGSVPNTFGAATTSGNLRGNMNAKFNLPLIVTKGTTSSSVASDPMSLDEVSNNLPNNGVINFSITASGTYKDSFGSDVTFGSKSGSFAIRSVKSTCEDNTPVDYDKSDSDTSNYCSTGSVGKYCRVNTITGQPTYTDRASICGCCTPGNPGDISCGKVRSGDICKSTGCTPNSCIAGTVSYCKSDGSSFETRCQYCTSGLIAQIQSKCPLDIYGQQAINCNPTSSGVSQCVYQNYGASGLQLILDPPVITSEPQCGDGVKNGAEQCDTYDFGGDSCTTSGLPGGPYTGGTISCSACNYVVTGCTKTYIKFRTIYADISNSANVDGIAWNSAYSSTCNSGPLITAGEYTTTGFCGSASQLCSTYLLSLGYTKMFDITSGVTSVTRGSCAGMTSNKALWVKGTDYLVAADNGVGRCAATGFRQSVSTSISNSGTATGSLEAAC